MKRSLIARLPNSVREELNKRLADNAFSSYLELSEWLKSLGYLISKSSIHRYGANHERRIQAIKASTEAATMITNVAPSESTLSLLRRAQFLQMATDGELRLSDVIQPLAIEDLVEAIKQLATRKG